MSDQATTKPQATENGTGPSRVPADSPMAELRALREDIQKDDHLDLEIPGYQRKLAVRYRTMPRKELLAYVRASEEEPDNDERDIQFLIDICLSVLYRDKDGFEPITDENGPLRFDRRLAAYFGFDGAEEMRAREVVAEVFALDRQPLAVSVHANNLIRWMQGADVKANEGLLGE